MMNTIYLKGTPGKDAIWSQNTENVKILHLQALSVHVVVPSVFMQQTYWFGFEFGFLWEQAYWFTLCHWKTKAGSYHNRHLCHTQWPYSWHHRHRLPDTKWKHAWPCFCDFQTSTFNKLHHTSTEKLLLVFFIFFFIPFTSKGLVIFLGLGSLWNQKPTAVEKCPGKSLLKFL